MPESAFRLYAVCSRYPNKLAQAIPWEALREGVYQCRRGTDVIRIVVAGQLAHSEHNALLHLFSAAQAQVLFGAQHYRQRSPQTSTLLEALFVDYQREGVTMPYTMEDFIHEYVKTRFKRLTLREQQEALESLSPEQRDELELLLQRMKDKRSSPAPKKRKRQ